MNATIARIRPCRSCQASILLLKNVSTGRWMPVDDNPHPDGNIRVDVYRSTADVLSGARLSTARDAAEPLSRAHHTTCPASGRHRGPSNRPPTLFDPDHLDQETLP